MSYEITYDENVSNNTKQKIIIVNRKDVYKMHLEKEAFRKNEETGVKYVLDVKCDESGVNIQATLPHEVMVELNNMISDSLSF